MCHQGNCCFVGITEQQFNILINLVLVFLNTLPSWDWESVKQALQEQQNSLGLISLYRWVTRLSWSCFDLRKGRMNSLVKGCGDSTPFAHGSCSDQVGNGPKPGKSDGPGCSSSQHKQMNSCKTNSVAFTQKSMIILNWTFICFLLKATLLLWLVGIVL